ncbi:MAG TPA: GNAT family protein [Puia sp.]|uniref:GNAT family N-acetyltransferase n=1 Tax=Puia sp. TaxID=2045100 RepID=UPI002B573B3D|nr:GNAT family protein [Puia sp.]HVU95577.1 GNAT family protein [Puia sp.]
MIELNNPWITLRFLKEGHRATLRRLAKDERIWEYTKTLLLTDTYDRQFDKYFDDALGFSTPAARAYCIFDAVTGDTIGMTRAYDLDPRVKKATIGHTWYTPAVWGKVHNKACKLLLLEYLFETIGLQRVDFRVAGQNIRSQKAVMKIGGMPEGVLRRYSLRNDGTYADAHYFSILGDEWPEKKVRLQEMVNALAAQTGS